MTDDLPTPDELLFELWDWLPLAFPRAIRAATLKISPTSDKKNGCLVDLDGESAPDAPLRPDLGYADSEVLDNVNALLQSFLQAVTPRIGAVRRGTLQFDAPDSDGAMMCTLKNQNAVEKMSRRIDRSERQLFVHTAPFFTALNATWPREEPLIAAGRALIAQRSQFVIDTDDGTVTFRSDDHDVGVRYGIDFLGTHHAASRNFVWADKNPGVPAPLAARVAAFRNAQSAYFLGAWQHAEHFLTPVGALRVTAHVAVHLSCSTMVALPVAGPNDTLTLYAGLSPGPH